MKTKQDADAKLLQLLKKVLPKATHDPQLAGQIYQAVEQELRVSNRASAFDKFCQRVEMPDLEPASVEAVHKQFKEAFGKADITLKPFRKEKVLAVEVATPEGQVFSGQVKVGPPAPEESEDPEFKPKFIPFPVCMPGDKELVWMLAKRENLSPDEAGMALAKAEDDFWASKTGQKLLRDRVDRTFPEFISRVPAGMLGDAGLKRHYKTPEAIKTLRSLKVK